MWMAYSAQYWPKVVDLESGVQRIQTELRDLCFEVEHEAVYNLSAAYDPEQVQLLKHLADSYSEADDVCNLYLQGEISLECWFYEFVKLNLERFFSRIKNFVPEELRHRFYSDDSSEEESEEEDSQKENHVGNDAKYALFVL